MPRTQDLAEKHNGKIAKRKLWGMSFNHLHWIFIKTHKEPQITNTTRTRPKLVSKETNTKTIKPRNFSSFIIWYPRTNSNRRWSGARVGVGMLRGMGTHHLITLDLEVYQDSTIVNSRFLQKEAAKVRSIWRYQNFKIIPQKVYFSQIFLI